MLYGVLCLNPKLMRVTSICGGALAIEGREDAREVVGADVDDDADARGVLVRPHLVEEGLDQLDGQVVDAVEAEVFERPLYVALAGAGETGDDDEVFGALHRAAS